MDFVSFRTYSQVKKLLMFFTKPKMPLDNMNREQFC